MPETAEKCKPSVSDGAPDLASRKKSTEILKNLLNAVNIIRYEYPGMIGYNEFRQRLELRQESPWGSPPGPWSDRDTRQLTLDIANRYTTCFNTATMAEAVAAVADKNHFNPAQDRLRELSEQWDGQSRLRTWLTDYLNVSSDESNSDYLAEISEKWLIGVAARILLPGCKRDDVLVLQGNQGWGKSTAANAISDCIALDAFTDSIGDLGSKDAKSGIRGKIIAEFGELATMNKSDIETVKAFISAKSDNFRPAYGRLEIEFPRTVSFIASTNSDSFLKDPTGNRRWWPVTISSPIDIPNLKAVLPQLLGEAARRVQAGDPWFVTGIEALKQADGIRDSHFAEDPWTCAVLEYASQHANVVVRDVMEALELRIEQQTVAASNRVAGILKANGFVPGKRIRRGTGGGTGTALQVRTWVKPEFVPTPYPFDGGVAQGVAQPEAAKQAGCATVPLCAIDNSKSLGKEDQGGYFTIPTPLKEMGGTGGTGGTDGNESKVNGTYNHDDLRIKELIAEGWALSNARAKALDEKRSVGREVVEGVAHG